MAKDERVRTTLSGRFFDELGSRGYEPLLGGATGTVRVELVDRGRTQRWLVTVDRGDVSVSRRNATADCVVRAERSVFDAIVKGQTNAMAAFLRGDVEAEGDPELLLVLQRVFGSPVPRSSSGPERRERRPRR